MTDRPSTRWLLTSGAASRLIRTGPGADDTVIEVGIDSGDGERTIAATIVYRGRDACVVSVSGRATVVRLAPHADGCQAMANGDSFLIATATGESTDEPNAGETSPAADLDALAAPMPATVSAIVVQPGAVVRAGDALVRLEAMKMELAVCAPAGGRVATVDCRVGDLVHPGRPLVTLEPGR